MSEDIKNAIQKWAKLLKNLKKLMTKELKA